MSLHMMRFSHIYTPPHLRIGSTFEERGEYYQVTWPYLLDKWKRYGAHEIAFAPENPLGQWRDMVQGIYNIGLKM